MLAFSTVALIYNSQTLDVAKLSAVNMELQLYGEDNKKMIDLSSSKVDFESLPEHVTWSFVCVEDKNFFKHHGVSYERIAKAAYKNASKKTTVEGASTITQQLIKNTQLSHEKTFSRKIREATLARKLEKKYSKNEILQMYFNAIYFGNGIYGLEGASKYYFNKSAKELNLKESACLSGMIKNPSRYDPFSRRQSFESRGDLVMKMMHEQGKISQADFDEAKTQPLEIVTVKNKRLGNVYRNAAITQASQLLGKSVEELIAQGYKIYTFYDAAAQNAVANVLSNDDYKIKNISDGVSDNCIIAANLQGGIIALHTNNATLPYARRNFASALKPLVVFAPALELDVVTTSTKIVDEPYTAGDFHPKNHDGKFHGEVTVRESLIHSHNIPAVKILDYTRINKACDIASRLGLTLGEENLSLALGNASEGISFMELIGGYAALANGGLKTSPSFVKRIENANGKVVWEHTNPYIRAISERTSFLVTDMLKDTVKVGTASKLSSLDFEIASKTGSAERDGTNTDAINVSYTPNFVLMVWNGNASMKPENDLRKGTTGGGVTSFIARDIARELNKGRNSKFNVPDGVEDVKGKYDIANAKQVNAPLKYALKVSSKIGETGAPTIKFDAHKDKVYHLHRKVNGTTTLLEVIKRHEGLYVYIDSNAPKGKVIDYWVTCKYDDSEIASDVIKIFTAAEINKNSKPKRNSGKQWFF